MSSLNITDITNNDWTKISNNMNNAVTTVSQSTPLMKNGQLNMGWIKNPQEMGITDPNTTINTKDVNKNMNSYQQYYNALMTGNSPATKIQNNGKPLGNREFVKNTGIQCLDTKNNIQDRYYVVDGMAIYNGNTVNNGLMNSAYQTLQDIKDIRDTAGNILNGTSLSTTYQDNSCVLVNLIKDGKGNTESGYISTNEYNIWKKKNPPIFSESFSNSSYQNKGCNIRQGVVFGYNSLNNYGNYSNYDNILYLYPDMLYNYPELESTSFRSISYKNYDFIGAVADIKSSNNEGRRPE